MMQSFISKIQEQSPVNSTLVRCAESLLLFCTTHGQAAIERGFNVNKDILSENLQESSLIAKRIVYDQIKARNSPLISFDVSLKLINKCKHANMAYKEDLRKIALE